MNVITYYDKIDEESEGASSVTYHLLKRLFKSFFYVSTEAIGFDVVIDLRRNSKL